MRLPPGKMTLGYFLTISLTTLLSKPKTFFPTLGIPYFFIPFGTMGFSKILISFPRMTNA